MGCRRLDREDSARGRGEDRMPMALTTCRECGLTGVSSEWRAICPGCGVPHPGHRGLPDRQRAALVLVAWGVALLAGVAMFLLARH